jgi:putative membrane protein
MPPDVDGKPASISREQLTEEKKRVIRLVVAFVVATKHDLRSEGGVHHADLQGKRENPCTRARLMDRASSAPSHAQGE